VLCEHAAEYFDVKPGSDLPYMLVVAPVAADKRLAPGPDAARTRGIDKLGVPRSEIQAVTHVDYSARIQTVDPERHGLYHQLLATFARKTGCSVLVNTSFNLGWDPIVCTPREAYDTFMSSEIDVLVLGHFLLAKSAQPATVPAQADDRPEAVLEGLWSSPCCHDDLIDRAGQVACSRCGRRFPVEDGIPLLFYPHDGFATSEDVTAKVRSFYEETPFPNYDEHDSVRSLIEKSRRGGYARRLNEAIPYNSTVLEVGCGTGQLTNFLGISCRRVVGADLCLNSLRLAEDFRRRHGLNRVRFVQMNLFRPCFKPEQFDVILCNGVLHHTSDPRGGFQELLPLLRPGGYFVIGLYNRYGRSLTDLRRFVFKLTGGRAKWIDPYLRAQPLGEDKRRAWFADQYQHPHESKHTIGEVLDWFDKGGLEFVRGIPPVTLGGDGPLHGSLFELTPRGQPVNHFLTQLKQVVTGSREGGFFLLIGRKQLVGLSVKVAEPSMHEYGIDRNQIEPLAR
jgi:SAM-dependent methyltransferase